MIHTKHIHFYINNIEVILELKYDTKYLFSFSASIFESFHFNFSGLQLSSEVHQTSLDRIDAVLVLAAGRSQIFQQL